MSATTPRPYLVTRKGFEQIYLATSAFDAINQAIAQHGFYGAAAKRITLQ